MEAKVYLMYYHGSYGIPFILCRLFWKLRHKRYKKLEAINNRKM